MIKKLLAMAAVAALFVGGSNLYAQCQKPCSPEKGSCGTQQKGAESQQNGATIGEAPRPVTRVELAGMLEQGSVSLFDARDEASYEAGHIEGARLLQEAILPSDKAAHLVFYCGGTRCPAASRAARKAIELGYTNVMVFKEGWAGWKAS